jgi:plasmid stability protein
MWSACNNARDMSKMIQIRNVPDDLHRQLKAKAAERGLSLSDLLLRMAEREAATLSWAEVAERARRRPRARGASAADLVRAGRDGSA